MLHYKKMGQGQPLIILHGVFGSLDNWQTIGKQLAQNFEVYLVDQRNHGRSFHSDKFDYDVMSEDVIEMIHAEGIENCILMGHSMGGKNAMYIVSKAPESIEKLVVVDMAPKYYLPHHQHILAGFNAVQISKIQSRQEADVQMKKVLSDAGIRQFLLKNLQREADGFSWKINLNVIEKNIENIGKGVPESLYFDKETLFIRGSKSDYVQDNDLEVINGHFPNSRIVTIPGAGHWVHAEKPREMYEALTAFLSGSKE